MIQFDFFSKLIKVLSHLIIEKPEQEKNEVLLKTMKCLEYLIRFIVKSRELHAKLTQRTDQHEFQSLFQGTITYSISSNKFFIFYPFIIDCLTDLLDNITIMMPCSSKHALTSQGTCLKYLPATVPHVTRVFPDTQLSYVSHRKLQYAFHGAAFHNSRLIVAWWSVEYWTICLWIDCLNKD